MPGESILVVDGSQAVQEIARSALYGAGYNVTTVSNGAAALTCPGLEEVNLLVVDRDMAGFDGTETTRILKQNGPTHPIPVLMLISDEKQATRASLELGGACAWLLKPFDARALVRKVEQILEQSNLDELAQQYLADAADRKMQELAENHIAQAIERKTQLIIERSIHTVTSAVDQRARGEVEQRIAGLVSEKEQELVKLTVREVANSMVEKLAQSKVEEAMQTILKEETERAIRRATDQVLPNTIREKAREMLANMLPREVEKQVQKATEKMAPELSQQIVGTVEAVAQKNIPRVAREVLPPVVENQVAMALDQALTRRVSDLVGRELSRQMAERVEPLVDEATSRIRRSVLIVNSVIGALMVGTAAFVIYLLYFAGR